MKTPYETSKACERSAGAMWRRRALVGSLAFLASMALGLSEARAQGGPEGGERPGPAHRMRADRSVGAKRMAASLQLTPAQRQQIKRLRQETRRDLADEQAQLRQLTLQLREAWQSPQPNERQILGLRQRIAALRAVVQEQHVRLRLSVLALLTPEQRVRFQRAMAERAARGPRRPMSRPVRIATP